MAKTDKVILGEVDSKNELDKAVAFLKGFGLFVWGHHIDTSAAELRPGKNLHQDSDQHFLLTCNSDDYETYRIIFDKCSAGYTTGARAMEEGRQRTSPALWDMLPAPNF